MEKASAPPPYAEYAGQFGGQYSQPSHYQQTTNTSINFPAPMLGEQQPPPYFQAPVINTTTIPPPPPGIITVGDRLATPVMVNQPITLYGRYPITVSCPYCSQQVLTQTRTEIGSAAWFMCFFCAAVGLWPCCLIPLCISGFHDTYHACPSCHKVIDVYRPL